MINESFNFTQTWWKVGFGNVSYSALPQKILENRNPIENFFNVPTRTYNSFHETKKNISSSGIGIGI